MIKCSSLEDKLQKMELDREQQRLKTKQQVQMQTELEEKVDKLSGEKENIHTSLKEAIDSHESALKTLNSDFSAKSASLTSQL